MTGANAGIISIQGLAQLLLIFAVAGIAVPLLKRLKISPVIGYLVCGLLIGPNGMGSMANGFGWLRLFSEDDLDFVHLMGEVGIIFLMFSIGLKLSLPKLIEMRRYILGIGSYQIIGTGAVIAFVAYLFKNSLEVSLLIGGSFALSSTAMVLQLLDERNMLHRRVGKLSFSILLMQDLAVVPMLVLLAVLARQHQDSLLIMTAKAAVLSVGVVALIYFVGTRLVRPFLTYFHPVKNHEWLLSVTLLVVICSALLTEASGLSAALGAFLAGLLLAETTFSKEIESLINPVKGLFLGVFFLSIGMMIDIRQFLREPTVLIVSVLGLAVIKSLVLFVVLRLFELPRRVSAESAILLGQGGEFVFVIMTMAVTYQLMTLQVAQFFMLVTALSLMITPFMVQLIPYVDRRLARK